VHRTRGNCSSYRIFWIVNLIAAPILKPWASMYSLEASILRVTRLHLIKDQYSIFASWLRSVSTSIKPICNNRSLLLAKEASVNTSRLREFRSSGTKVSPLIALSICH
jgi:hypothetical protein